jgi:hypothetical protein
MPGGDEYLIVMTVVTVDWRKGKCVHIFFHPLDMHGYASFQKKGDPSVYYAVAAVDMGLSPVGRRRAHHHRIRYISRLFVIYLQVIIAHPFAKLRIASHP